MHWLLLLSILSSTTSVQQGADVNSASRLIENALRQKLGGARQVRVQLAPAGGRMGGEFDRITVNLDGFSADRLEGLSGPDDGPYNTYPDGGDPRDNRRQNRRDDRQYPPTDFPYDEDYLNGRSLDRQEIDDILGGIFNGRAGSGGDIGGVLGGFLKGGRIGRLQFKATNFTYGGAQYDSLSADLGEIRFDWGKALRGEMDIKSIQPGSLALSLRSDQLARLLGPRLPQLENLKVSFRDGRAFVGARSNFYGLRVPFEVGARLSVTRNQVIANDWRASLANVNVPGFVLDEITQRANPLYDFDPNRRWPIAVDLQTAGTNNNALALRGGLRFLGFNRRDEPVRPQPAPRRSPSRVPRDNEDNRGSGDIFDIFRDR